MNFRRIAFICVENDYRSVVDSQIHGIYGDGNCSRQELARKARTIAHGMKTVLSFLRRKRANTDLLFIFMLINHKVMRWLSPYLILLFVLVTTNICLRYIDILPVHLAVSVTSLATLCMIISEQFRLSLSRLMVFFLAPAVALYLVVCQKDLRKWQPTRRAA